MNRAAYHLINRRILQEAVQNGRLLQKQSSTRRLLANEKKVSGKVTSLVLTKNFQKFHSWEKWKLQLSLCLLFWGQVVPPWAYWFFFLPFYFFFTETNPSIKRALSKIVLSFQINVKLKDGVAYVIHYLFWKSCLILISHYIKVDF